MVLGPGPRCVDVGGRSNRRGCIVARDLPPSRQILDREHSTRRSCGTARLGRDRIPWYGGRQAGPSRACEIRVQLYRCRALPARSCGRLHRVWVQRSDSFVFGMRVLAGRMGVADGSLIWLRDVETRGGGEGLARCLLATEYIVLESTLLSPTQHLLRGAGFGGVRSWRTPTAVFNGGPPAQPRTAWCGREAVIRPKPHVQMYVQYQNPGLSMRAVPLLEPLVARLSAGDALCPSRIPARWKQARRYMSGTEVLRTVHAHLLAAYGQRLEG